MTARARRWPVVVPAALALLAALELAAYLLFGPVTTAPDGTTGGALAAGNIVVAGIAVVAVVGAAVGVVGAVRSNARFVWLPAAALALVGVVGTPVGPQVLVVALLLVIAALLEEARPDVAHPRRNGTDPAPSGRPSGPGSDGDASAVTPPVGGDASPRCLESRSPGPAAGDRPPASPTTADGVRRGTGGPNREVVLAAGLLVPLAALLGLSAVTTSVARVAVAATAAVVLGGAALSVGAVARG